MYLIYETKLVAVDRADEEGKYNNLSYWVNGTGSRWISKPILTGDNKWVLDVSDYDLDDIEEVSIVYSYVPVEEEI